IRRTRPYAGSALEQRLAPAKGPDFSQGIQAWANHCWLWIKWSGTARQTDPVTVLRARGRRGCGRTFSVHLDDNVFHCFDVGCAAKGDVIDLWARLRGLPLRDAALDLVDTFGLEPAPRTEKRSG